MTVPILASPAPLRLASPPLAVVLILMIEGVCALLLLQHSGLLKTRDAADFYKSFGFEECKSLCMIRTSEKSGL